MIPNLLPGLREIRAPVVSGYLWLVFFYLVLHGDLPSSSHPDSTFQPLFNLADDLSVLGIATVASVAAYLVGSAMQEVLKLLGRLSPWWGPLYAEPGTHATQSGKNSLRRAVRVQVDRITRRLLQVALSPGERGIDKIPDIEAVVRELPLVRTLLLGKHPELVGELDRLQAEADLRITVSVPLGALSVYLAFESSPGWALGLIPAVMLLVQGYQRQHEAGDFLIRVLQMGRVTAPAVQEFEVSVEAALERTDLEWKLKGEMADGDGMAAFRYANLLSGAGEYEKAIEPLQLATHGGVLQAYAELGFAWLQLDDHEKAERAFRDGAERGDLRARERLAELLHELQRTEEALETETDEGDTEKAEDLQEEEPDLPREQARIADYKARAAAGDAKASFNLGLLLDRREEAEEAIEAFRLAVDLDPADTQALTHLGGAEIRRGQFTNARAALERALEIQESDLGPDHLEVGLTLGTLGSVMSELGQDERALDLKRRALAIIERELGPNGSEVAVTKVNIGRSLVDLGQYSDALIVLEDALEIQKRLWGDDDPRLGAIFNNIGNARRYLGEYRTALTANERSLALFERSGLKRGIAAALSNIGHVCAALGDYQKALDLQTQALKIQEEEFGANAVGVTDSLDGTGEALSRLGRYADALKILDRSWGIKEAHGVSDLRIAQTLVLRAEALGGVGDLDISVEAGGRAATVFEERLGADSPLVARASIVIGESQLRAERLQQAERQFARAIELGEASKDERDFALGRALCALARVMIERRELAEAEGYASRAIDVTEKRFGPLFPEVATCLEVWADIRDAKGETQAAMVARERAATIRRSATSVSTFDQDTAVE